MYRLRYAGGKGQKCGHIPIYDHIIGFSSFLDSEIYPNRFVDLQNPPIPSFRFIGQGTGEIHHGVTLNSRSAQYWYTCMSLWRISVSHTHILSDKPETWYPSVLKVHKTNGIGSKIQK